MDAPDSKLMEILGKIAAGEGAYIIGYSDHDPEQGDWVHHGGNLSTRLGLVEILRMDLDAELERSYDDKDEAED